MVSGCQKQGGPQPATDKEKLRKEPNRRGIPFSARVREVGLVSYFQKQEKNKELREVPESFRPPHHGGRAGGRAPLMSGVQCGAVPRSVGLTVGLRVCLRGFRLNESKLRNLGSEYIA